MEINPNENYIVYIKGDTNDADYISEETTLSGEDILKYVVPVTEKIKAWNKANPRSNNHNWNYSEYARGTHPDKLYELDEITAEYWADIIPYGEHGIHTIETVEIRPLISDKLVLV